MYIPIVLGTAREGRYSEKVAKYLLSRVKKRKNIKTEIIDVRDFLFGRTIPPWEKNPAPMKWRKIVTSAEGFIIVSPEYNHGFPGELKILLDSAYKEYERKPAVIAAVSSGIFGGARMIEVLIHSLRKLKLVVPLTMLNFPKIEGLFDESGKILDATYDERVENFIDDLLWYVETLNYGRKNIK